MSSWQQVFDCAAVFGIEPLPLIAAAKEVGATPEELEAAFARTLSYRYGSPADTEPDFADFNAVPPGILDARVLRQDQIWVDILRRRKRVQDMSQEELSQLCDLLHANAPKLQKSLGQEASGDALIWLEETPLLRRIMKLQRRGLIAITGVSY